MRTVNYIIVEEDSNKEKMSRRLQKYQKEFNKLIVPKKKFKKEHAPKNSSSIS